MCQAVAHPDDGTPRNARLGGEKLGADVLHCFADLDASDANGVEHQPVTQVTAPEV